jgi:hypothetical protein
MKYAVSESQLTKAYACSIATSAAEPPRNRLDLPCRARQPCRTSKHFDDTPNSSQRPRANMTANSSHTRPPRPNPFPLQMISTEFHPVRHGRLAEQRTAFHPAPSPLVRFVCLGRPSLATHGAVMISTPCGRRCARALIVQAAAELAEGYQDHKDIRSGNSRNGTREPANIRMIWTMVMRSSPEARKTSHVHRILQ